MLILLILPFLCHQDGSFFIHTQVHWIKYSEWILYLEGPVILYKTSTGSNSLYEKLCLDRQSLMFWAFLVLFWSSDHAICEYYL